MYFNKGPVPEKDYAIPFSKGEIKREGNDFTIVAISNMVHEARASKQDLELSSLPLLHRELQTLQALHRGLLHGLQRIPFRSCESLSTGFLH